MLVTEIRNLDPKYLVMESHEHGMDQEGIKRFDHRNPTNYPNGIPLKEPKYLVTGIRQACDIKFLIGKNMGFSVNT